MLRWIERLLKRYRFITRGWSCKTCEILRQLLLFWNMDKWLGQLAPELLAVSTGLGRWHIVAAVSRLSKNIPTHKFVRHFHAVSEILHMSSAAMERDWDILNRCTEKFVGGLSLCTHVVSSYLCPWTTILRQRYARVKEQHVAELLWHVVLYRAVKRAHADSSSTAQNHHHFHLIGGEGESQ